MSLSLEALEFAYKLDALSTGKLHRLAVKIRKMAEADSEQRQKLLILAEGIEDMAMKREVSS